MFKMWGKRGRELMVKLGLFLALSFLLGSEAFGRGYFPGVLLNPGAFGRGYFSSVEVLPEMPPYWHLERIRAFEAQGVACGEGITVVVIDSGVDYEHPDLSDHLRLDLAYDFGDNDTDVMDLLGHGTAVASLVLQVAPCAKIIPLKLSPGGDDFFESEAVVSALQYTLELIRNHPEIKIVNMSFGLIPGEGEEAQINRITDLIREIHDAGVLMVGAAGNEGIFGVDFPASLPEVIAVSGTDGYDGWDLYSNRGEEVLISAPSDHIYVAVPTILGGYTYAYGTSMAAPLVSGTLALILEILPEKPELSLAGGSEDLGEPGHDPYYGFGRLSVLGAVVAAVSRDLPVLPSYVEILPGEEREVFFLPQEGVEFLVLDGEVAEVVSFQPNRGLIKIRGKALGETEIFLYRLSPLRANRIRVVVTESPQDFLEGLLCPSIFDSRASEVYLCRYLSLLNFGVFGSYLELVYPDEGRFVRTYLWDYPGPLSSGIHVDCALTDPSLFSKGLQEILLCNGGFYSSCVRHVFFVE